MYSLTLRLKFRARHFLIGGDWGAENRLHAHPYVAEWTLEGPSLDEHGYLLDLVAVEQRLNAEIDLVRGRVLNELEGFQGLNPSVERLARHLSDRLLAGRDQWDPSGRLRRSTVAVWENQSARAAWSAELP